MITPRTHTFQLLIHGFEAWLRALGYAQSTVYGSVRFAGEFLAFLESQSVQCLDEAGPEHMEGYGLYLGQRPQLNRKGGLGQNSITANLGGVRRFGHYLRQTGKCALEVSVSLPKAQTTPERMILSLAEIRSLYRATGESFLGIRDRAMLGIYYGCGLRRSEGVALELQDADVHRNLLFVRRGKGYSERYVPFSGAVKKDFAAWLEVRGQGGVSATEKAFLTGVTGKALKGPAVMERLKALVRQSGLDPSTGVHTLRHSIATHLLQGGMSLEMVSRFLGHRSLESTQIYTHLANESTDKF